MSMRRIASVKKTQSYQHSHLFSYTFRLCIFFMTFPFNTEAYITYRFDSRNVFNYPSYSSRVGRSFGNDYYYANLYTAPEFNMDLCSSHLNYDYNRSLTIDNIHPNHHSFPLVDAVNKNDAFESLRSNPLNLSLVDIPDSTASIPIRRIESHSKSIRKLQRNYFPIALLVDRGGGCKIEDKARNAVLINEEYASQGGPKIQYLVIGNDGNGLPVDGDDSGSSRYDFLITYVGQRDGTALKGLMHEVSLLRGYSYDKIYRLNQDAFLPYKDGTERWQFIVVIDDSRLTFPYIYMLYIFIGIIIGVPLVRFMVLILANRGCRWRRNESGRINGLAWNRPSSRFRMWQQQSGWYQGDEGDGIFMSAWRGLEGFILGKLTQEHINALPVIEYNVTDIEEITNRYKNDGEKHNLNNAKVDDKINEVGDDESDKIQEDIEAKNPENIETKDKGMSNFLHNIYETCTCCSICIDEFKDGEKLILLPQCGHFFHPQCINPWLKDNKDTCPLCQTRVVVVRDERPVARSNDPNSTTIDLATNPVQETTVLESSATDGNNNSSSRNDISISQTVDSENNRNSTNSNNEESSEINTNNHTEIER